MLLFSFLKNWTLPVAILVGTLSYLTFAYVPALDEAGDSLLPVFETLLPVTLFCTLFVTFSKVDFHLMRLRRWHLLILAAQFLLIGVLVGLLLHSSFINDHSSMIIHQSSFDSKLLLEAVLICVIAPCASASPVVTAKLGGDLTQMTTFVLLSSVLMALLIPVIFPMVEPHSSFINPHSSFIIHHSSVLTHHSSVLSPHSSLIIHQSLAIFQRLAAVLLLPLLLGAVVRHWVQPLYRWFVRTPDLGFYCWCVSLAITAGITVRNIVHSQAGLALLGAIAVLTLLTSFLQFAIGRAIGRAVGEHICTGQGMFQKNTGLAIWIAYTFLTPEASIGAGCYVLWQNIINSYELWRHRKQ